MPGAISGLIGAGGGGTIGGAVVRLVLDSSQFNAGLAQAQGRLQSIGSSMSRIGGTLTRGVTVPLVAAGAVATKMALDFNKAFVQIQTLASKGGHSIAEMKAEVLSLAQATGQDPTGLANALYQVVSAGKVAASQAFPILEASAKAAAIGMGSAADVAKVLTTTMNSYGPSTISAATAADVLTQAQKDSANEADALAGSIGPVIGVAAQVGVSFQEVAAAMATATVAGIDTARAATGLRFLLTSLAAPTDAAKTALDQYGISVQDLQRMLSNQGLIGTMQSLAKTFDLSSVKGQEAWRALTGGARGAIAANTLVGKTADVATAELDKLNGAAGRLNKSFTIWGQTITGKNAIALGRLKVAAIELGQKLIPIFEQVVNAVTGLVDAFSKLSPAMQGVVVKGLVIAALAGPLLKLVGVVLQVAGAFKTLGTASAAVNLAGGGGGLLAMGPQLIGITFAVKGLVDELSAFKSGGLGAAVASAVKTMDSALGIFNQDLRTTTNSGRVFDAGMTRTGRSVAEAGLDAFNAAGGMKVVGAAMKQADTAALALNHALPSASRGLSGVGGSANSAAGDMKGAAGAAVGLTGAINRIPSKHDTKVTADTGQALGAIGAVIGAIARIPSSVTSTIHVVTVRTGATGGAGVYQQAQGGIIRGASGFITRGPTYMVGEGNYSTFAGRGAEAVTPLNDRGIGILSKALKKAGAGGPNINVTINTQGAMNPDQLAASVSRHLARTIREEALV